MSSVLIKDAAAEIQPPALTAKQLAGEVACRKCGGSLLGLRLVCRCPGCGMPVGLSVHGDLLRFSNPVWLRTLRRGVTLLIWAAVIGSISSMGMLILKFTWPELRKVTASLCFAGPLMEIAGVWELTKPDPSGAGENQYGISRRIARIALIGTLASSVFTWMRHGLLLSPDVGLKIVAGIAFTSACGVIGGLAQMNYLAKLARRIPDARLSAQAFTLMYAMSLSQAAVIIAWIPMIIAEAKSPGAERIPDMTPMGCFGFVAGVAFIICLVKYVLLLIELRKSLDNNAAAADLIDAQTAPPTAST